MSDFVLVIANKAYSSWSLRAWLAMKLTGAPFEEILIPLDLPSTAAEIARHSPSGLVPVLRHGRRTVWESIAIIEYLAELFPDAGLWPADTKARATARAVSAEMHAGFRALRANMPMNVRASHPGRGQTREVLADIARITALWSFCRDRYGAGGDYLFGGVSAADAMFAPVCTRFRTYAVALETDAQAYCDAVFAWPAMVEWLDRAAAEPWRIEKYEAA
jgi:glutathione S-transferase